MNLDEIRVLEKNGEIFINREDLIATIEEFEDLCGLDNKEYFSYFVKAFCDYLVRIE